MGSAIFGLSRNLVLLETETERSGLWNRIFALDGQLGADVIISILAVLFMFFMLSYLVFNPARNLMQKRQAMIKGEMDYAAKEKQDAVGMKAAYDAKLKKADAEVEVILSEGKKKALKRENDIVDEALKEADRIRSRADKEAQLEKNRMQEEFKQEMVTVAAAMAVKMISGSMDDKKQAELIDEALNGMGDKTWQS